MSLTDLLETEAPAEDVEALDRQLRLMVRTLLDGYPAGRLRMRFPNVSFFLGQVRPRHDSEIGARLAVANTLAFQVGWRLFEPLLRSAVGIDEMTDADLSRAVGAELARIVEPH